MSPLSTLTLADERGLSTELVSIAKAVAGDHDMVARLAQALNGGLQAQAHRVGPILAGHAKRLGISGGSTDQWNDQLRAATAWRVILGGALDRAREALSEGWIEWAPIKGVSLGQWLYPAQSERPTTDIDLLIRQCDLAKARASLTAAGFRSCASGREYERYLEEEAYNWKATDGSGALLELHFRLWGSVPASLGDEMLDRSSIDRSNGPTARRLQPLDELLLGAAHFWLTSPPRPLVYLWDLKRIIDLLPESQMPELSARSAGAGLDLFVGAAIWLVHRLWQPAGLRQVADDMVRRMRLAERLALIHISRSKDLSAPTAYLVVSRLLARRAARSGARSILRALWPHPGMVAATKQRLDLH